jgi:DNA-binding NarL/FixJ family response regulator
MIKRTVRATNTISIVERAYDVSGTEADWLSGVLEAARHDIDTGSGVYGFTGVASVSNFASSPVFVERELAAGFADRLLELNRDAPPEVFALMQRRQVTCGGLVSTLGSEHGAVLHFRSLFEPIGIIDGFSLFAHDGESSSITLSAPSRTVLRPPPRVQGIWRRVGIHVATALRLRRRLAATAASREALLDPGGKLEDTSPSIRNDRSACQALIAAVRGMERARGATMRRTPADALALWQGLVAGQWSLVEHWESSGRRYIAAYCNPPGVIDPRALTSSESAVLRYVGLGATNKEIAFTLGISSSAVSNAITQLLRKLRCKRRIDLAHFADPARIDRLDANDLDQEVGILAVDLRPSSPLMSRLSATEREIADYVLRGWSNERIAHARSVSVRTIANQLQSLYAKLQVSNRGELVAALKVSSL